MRYLLIMAGLGGLLYGVDVGVIAAALPYIEQTAGFNPSQLSQVVAAVLFGSVLSSLFAGYLADKMGRKALITVAAALFTASIPVICLSQEVFGIMLLGRILQGASAGIVGVVVPLYLAECLSAESRGKGTGMFQFLLTVGLVFAAVVGLLAASYVGGVENSGASEESLTSAKVLAWQAIFWVCAIPGLFLFFGSFRLSESPRYLFRRGRKDEAMAVLVRSYGDARAKEVFDEMVHIEEESITVLFPFVTSNKDFEKKRQLLIGHIWSFNERIKECDLPLIVNYKICMEDEFKDVEVKLNQEIAKIRSK